MKTLRKHTHADRAKAIEYFVPRVRKKLGANLAALAAVGSYARGQDSAYSDLELIAFVKKMPKGEAWGRRSLIRDGLLIVLAWTTKEIYLRELAEVRADWYAAGADTFLPILNKKFFSGIKKYKISSLKQKCHKQAASRWENVQEITGKVLNAIDQRNMEALPLLANEMLFQMLVVLAFLNQKSYTALHTFIAEAKQLPIKPASLNELIRLVAAGSQSDPNELERAVEMTFSQFEDLFKKFGISFIDAGPRLLYSKP